RRWALKRFSPRRGHPGRIHMSSASSARSAANAWITSSSSTRVTCGAFSRGIFNIITGPGHICHSTRIVRSLATYSLPLQVRLSRTQRSVVYIIAMNVARHDRRARFGVKDRRIFRPLCSDATEPRISIHFAPVADVPDLLTGPETHIPRSAAFHDQPPPIPTSNTFLSNDKEDCPELPEVPGDQIVGRLGSTA